ncbi:MAG: VanZ family protein [Flavobacteriales bacterium]|nr:VanZ family protein [Flavobacteriales bacterium]
MRQFIRHMIWTFVWMVIVILMYSIPGKDLPEPNFWNLLNFDKVAHLIVFFILSVIMNVGLHKQDYVAFLRRSATKIATVFCILFGGVLELFQGMLFEDRHSDVLDFLANVSGVILGAFFFRLLYQKW